MIDLTNKWMNDPTFLAESAHAFAAAFIVVTAALLGGRGAWAVGAAVLLMVLAGVKEFWYDANYELPKQTAGDNWLDFTFYGVGAAVGLLVVLLVKHMPL